VARFPYTYDDAVMETGGGAPMPTPFEALVVLSDVQVRSTGAAFTLLTSIPGTVQHTACRG
jgi:hypothetical protein